MKKCLKTTPKDKKKEFVIKGDKNKVAALFITYFGSGAKYHKELALGVVSLLKKQKQELREEIEKMKVDQDDPELLFSVAKVNYNQAIEDILKLLKKK